MNLTNISLILTIVSSIITIATFIILLTSRIIKIFTLFKLDKTVVRCWNESDNYDYEITIDNGLEKIVFFNKEENIFNVSFYEIEFDGKNFREIKKHDVQQINKLVAGDIVLINVTISRGIPNLKIKWENASGTQISAIVHYSGKFGDTLFQLKYKNDLKSFFYNIFN